MKIELTKGRLLISLKVRRKPKPSKSGKSLIIASTRGVRHSKVKIQGRRVSVNANAFISADHRP